MADVAALPTAPGLSDRTGYDPAFLGPGVPMPGVTTDAATVLLPYLHYSVLFRPDRKFAAVTALDLDGTSLQSIARTDTWLFDPRVPTAAQAGPPVYLDNGLDRGHLVMRSASTWGATPDEARQAEAETFYFTNAAPQAALFNQGHELWLGLEDYVLENAGAYERRLAVFAGPVLGPDDPPYRGIQIPLRFWKVVAFLQDGALAATGYVLDQTPLVHDVDAVLAQAAAAGEPPPLGAFRTFQVPIADIAVLAGVDLDQLVPVDRLGAPATRETLLSPRGTSSAWVELGSLDDVILRGPFSGK
jgi:endonuclease G, mitochondrial